MSDPLLGRVLRGRYRVERKLGQGGMGVVYGGIHLELARPVAIKTLLDVVDDRDIDRFRNEALAAASLSHPHIIQVTDFAPPKGDEPAFLVMELLAGRSLARVLSERRALPRAMAVHITLQMLDAIGAAHHARILHRDIKPANVFVLDGPDPDRPWIKVLDFGIAKLMDDSSRRTTTGTMMGTPAYMAPEQIVGERATEVTDLYAIGVCLYEMLAGSRPFAQSGGELVAEILKGEAPALPVDEELAAVVQRSMSRAATQRYATAKDFEAALRAVSMPKATPPTPQMTTPRPRWPLFVAVAAGTTTIGVGALVAITRKPLPLADSSDARADAQPHVDASAGADADIDAEATAPAEAMTSGVDASDDGRAPKPGPRVVLSMCWDGTFELCTAAHWYCECKTVEGFAVYDQAQNHTGSYTSKPADGEKVDGTECNGFTHSPSATFGRAATGRWTCRKSCSWDERVADRKMAVPGTPCTGHIAGTPTSGKWVAVKKK